jgi:hypothetical protein
MAWEHRAGNRSYCTRSVKRNGRVYREYYGTGVAGQLAAELDAQHRAERQASRDAQRELKVNLRGVEMHVETLATAVDLLAKGALLSVGFHRHDRCPWRRRRNA